MAKPVRRLNKTGFTFTEIIFVVTIFGLLAGIALPRIGQSGDQLAVRGAVDQFRAAHQKARTAAVRFGAVAELHVDDSADRFWVEIDTTVTGSRVMDTIGNVVDLSDSHVDLRATRSLICFDARGLVANEAGCPTTGALGVGLYRKGSSDTIRVTASGLWLSR